MPETRTAKLQSRQSDSRARAGTLMAPERTLMPARAPMVGARRAGDMMSEAAAMLLAGSTPPPMPVSTRNNRKRAKLGAKAEAVMAIAIMVRPPTATGRRPKESDKGPTIREESPQPTKVAAESWPATPTERLKSLAMSTSKGGIIKMAFWAAKRAKDRMIRNRGLFTGGAPGSPAGWEDGVTIFFRPLATVGRLWNPTVGG